MSCVIYLQKWLKKTNANCEIKFGSEISLNRNELILLFISPLAIYEFCCSANSNNSIYFFRPKLREGKEKN